jgi:hypothetical protein
MKRSERRAVHSETRSRQRPVVVKSTLVAAIHQGAIAPQKTAEFHHTEQSLKPYRPALRPDAEFELTSAISLSSNIALLFVTSPPPLAAAVVLVPVLELRIVRDTTRRTRHW